MGHKVETQLNSYGQGRFKIVSKKYPIELDE